METSQIISLVVLFLISTFFIIKIAIHKDLKREIFDLALGLYIIHLVISFILLLIIDNNSKKSPCPQYEKIENVYKLKQ